MASVGSITGLLARVSEGDEQARQDLFERVYAELKRLAVRKLGRRSPGHSLQASDLVNEVYERIHGGLWSNRQHFWGVVGRAMRQVIIDHARRRGAQRRQAPGRRVSLDELVDERQARAKGRLLAMDAALEKLARVDGRMVQIVELLFFVELDEAETARALQISVRTVQREWKTARSWLAKELR